MHERPHAEAKAAEAMPGSVVGARSLVAGIDLQSPRLSTVQVELLQALSDRHQDYIRQGRGREARAAESRLCKPLPRGAVVRALGVCAVLLPRDPRQA